LGEGQRLDALDLRRVDGHGGLPDALAEQFLDDQPAERVTDEHRRLVERGDGLGEVPGDVVDTAVGHRLRVFPGTLHRVRLTGPAGGQRAIAVGGEQLLPGPPGGGVQPQTVNEDDGGAVVRHRKLLEADSLRRLR
jgi:hypothetical protein